MQDDSRKPGSRRPVIGRISSADLPGSERARQFEGEAHGVGISFFLVDAPPGHGPDLHRHDYEEVFVVQAGSGIFTVAEQRVEAGPGDIVVAPVGVPHRFVSSGPERLRVVAVHHSPTFVTEWLDERIVVEDEAGP